MVAAQLSAAQTTEQQATNKLANKSNNANKVKPSYKHIPHSQKPPHLVAKRNARERRRVQAVNQAFYKLRRCVPIENRNKRVSKVKTLQRAIDYIRKLERILEDDDNQQQQSQILLVSGQLGAAMSAATAAATTTTSQTTMASSAQQAGKKRRIRVKSSMTNCDSASLTEQQQQGQVQTGLVKPRRGRKPNSALTDANRSAEASLGVHSTGGGQAGPQQVEARFGPAELLPVAGQEQYYAASLASECGYDQQQADVLRESTSVYNGNLSYFADQLEQHYNGASQPHYLVADGCGPHQQHHQQQQQQQQQQGGPYFDVYHGGYPAQPGAFYAAGHIGGAYASVADTSSSSQSYRQAALAHQPHPQQVGGWHEPADPLEGTANAAGKLAPGNLNDSVASSPSSAVSSSTRTSTSLNSSTTSGGSRNTSGINNKPSESSSASSASSSLSSSSSSSSSSATSTSSCANLVVSLALLQSPSSGSAASANSPQVATTDCPALSTTTSSSSPQQQQQQQQLANGTSLTLAAASNDNSSTPVVVRQQHQQPLLATARRQQVNNCLAYTANASNAHLSFAVNSGRDNNDNNNASYHHHHNHHHNHNHQRQLLNERKTASTCAGSSNINCGELQMAVCNASNTGAVVSASTTSGGAHHQVRHPMSGNNASGGSSSSHLNGGFSANNLHEQAHTLQYHQQQQQQFHHHHQHQQQQLPFTSSNQDPRASHSSGLQQPTLLDSSTTTTNSLISNQHRQTTIQEYTSLPL